MKAHPDAGGIIISWLVFGSNGHLTKPKGGVLENYTTRAPDDYDKWVKSICDPMRILDCTIHTPVYRKGFYGLDETGERTGCPVKHKHLDHIRINHYVTKSREEFIAKRERGKADQPGKWPMSYFYTQDRNDVLDTEILLLM